MARLDDIRGARGPVSFYNPVQRPSQPSTPARSTSPLPRPTGNGTPLDQMLASAGVTVGQKRAEEEEDEGFGRGLGFLINNPVTQGIVKPLEYLDYPRRVAISTMKEATDVTGGVNPFAGLAGLLPIWETDEDREWSWEDWKNQVQDPEFGAGQTIKDTGNQWLDRGVGLAGDIVYDPLTYLTMGTGAVAGKAGRASSASKLLNAQRAAEAAGDTAALNRLGGLGEVQRIATRGTGVATPAQLEALNLDQVGLRFAGQRIPGTGAIGRGLSEGLASTRGAINRAPGMEQLRRARSPKELEDAFEQVVTGQGGMGIDTAVDMIQGTQFWRRGEAGFREQMARRVNAASKELKDKSGTLVDESEQVGTDTVINQLMRTAREIARNFGSEIPELSGAAGDVYVPGVLNRGFRDYIKGDANLEARWLSGDGFAADDLLEESRFVQRRVLRPNPDGSPRDFTFKGPDGVEKTITIKTGTVEEKNRVLKEVFPEYKGKFYETDPQIIMESYVDSLARQVGRDFMNMKMNDISPKWAQIGIGAGDRVGQGFDDGVMEAVLDEDLSKAANKEAAQEARRVRDSAKANVETLNREIVDDISKARGGVRSQAKAAVGQAKADTTLSSRVSVAARDRIRELDTVMRGLVEQSDEMKKKLRADLRKISSAKSGAKRTGRRRQHARLRESMDTLDQLIATRNSITDQVRALSPEESLGVRAGKAKEWRDQADELEAYARRHLDALEEELGYTIPGNDRSLFTPEQNDAYDEAGRLLERARRGRGSKVSEKRLAAARKVRDDFEAELRKQQNQYANETQELRFAIDNARRNLDLHMVNPNKVGGRVSAMDEARRLRGQADEVMAADPGLDQTLRLMEDLPGVEAEVANQAARVGRIIEGTDPVTNEIVADTSRKVAKYDNQAINTKLKAQGAAAEHADMITKVDKETTQLLRTMDEQDVLRMQAKETIERHEAALADVQALGSPARKATQEQYVEDLRAIMPWVDADEDWAKQTSALLDNAMWNMNERAIDQRALAQAETNLRKANKGQLQKVFTAQLSDAWSAMHKGAVREGDIVMEAELARRFQNLYKITEDPKLLGKTLTAFTNFFKTYATLSPGFHVRNGMSAVFMNSSDGVPMVTQLRGMKLWRTYVREGDDWLAKQPAHIRGAFDAAFASGSGGRFFESGVAAGPAANTAFEKVFRNRATKASQKVGQDWVEGPVRLSMALDSIPAKVPDNLMDQAINDALDRITRIHFDYSQVSQFDETMRRLIPFWTFMSRNLPMQITQMWTKPRLYNQYNSFVRNFSDEDEPFTPDYFKNIGAFRVSLLDPLIPGDMPIYLQPDFAHVRVAEDMENIEGVLTGENLLRPLSDFNPFFTAPAEMALGTNFFTGRQYRDDDLTKLEGVNMAMAPFLLAMGQAERASDGSIVATSKGVDMMRSLNPILDRINRLAPQTTGGGDDLNRQLESIARFSGAPIRQLSPGQQRSQQLNEQFSRLDEINQQRALERAARGG